MTIIEGQRTISNSEDEIDLGALALQLSRRTALLAGLGVLGGIAGVGVTRLERVFRQPPLPQVVCRVEFKGSNNQPLPPGIVNDYLQIMTGTTVKLTVAEELGFKDKSLEELPFSVKAKVVAPGSALADVSVESVDPELALAVTNKMVKVTQQRMDEVQAARFSGAKESSDRIAALLSSPQESDGSHLSAGASTDLVTVIEKPRLLARPNDTGISRTAIGLGGGFALGVAAGAAWVLWLGQRMLINPEQAHEILGYPVLGETYKLKESSDLLGPQDMNKQAFRRLRYGLDQNSDLQTIIVGSAGRGEGKSTVALGLAEAYREVDEKVKVLVVDCDLENPTINIRTGLPKGLGLSDWMKDGGDPKQYIQQVPDHDFSVVTAGTFQQENLQEGFFESDAFKEFIKLIKQDFKHIIFDSPPYMAGTDMLSIAQVADRMLFVVSSGNTKSADASKALEDTARMAPRCWTGLVMNNLPLSRGNGYYGSYRK